MTRDEQKAFMAGAEEMKKKIQRHLFNKANEASDSRDKDRAIGLSAAADIVSGIRTPDPEERRA